MPENEKSEQEKELEALREALPEYEITPHKWKRGDEIRNNADLMAKNIDDQTQIEEGLLPFGLRTVICKDGAVRDISFTAPERIDWERTEAIHKEVEERDKENERTND